MDLGNSHFRVPNLPANFLVGMLLKFGGVLENTESQIIMFQEKKITLKSDDMGFVKFPVEIKEGAKMRFIFDRHGLNMFVDEIISLCAGKGIEQIV